MNNQIRVTEAEFRQDAARYQHEAQARPVTITRNGRADAVPVSAALFELLTKGRVARRVEDLDEETIDAIAASEVPPGYEHLDEIVKDWKP